MSNTFSLRRFGNYLVHDLRSAWSSTGLTLIITGAMPLFQFFIAEAISLIFSGSTMVMGPWGKIPAYLTAFLIVMIFFPAKHYGILTDRRAGSSWLMLPASPLEKWLSMLLVTCVAVPLFVTAELAAFDGLLSLIFPGTYGATAIADLASKMGMLWGELQTPYGGIAISWPYALWLTWCENILIFTLGAIFFKKSKIGLTFLSYFVLMMVITMGTAGLMQAIGLNNVNIDLAEVSEAGVIRTVNLVIYALYVVWFAIFDTLIYLRIKTLKH